MVIPSAHHLEVPARGLSSLAIPEGRQRAPVHCGITNRLGATLAAGSPQRRERPRPPLRRPPWPPTGPCRHTVYPGRRRVTRQSCQLRAIARVGATNRPDGRYQLRGPGRNAGTLAGPWFPAARPDRRSRPRRIHQRAGPAGTSAPGTGYEPALLATEMARLVASSRTTSSGPKRRASTAGMSWRWPGAGRDR
jgi:hypothetical protein